MDSRYLMDGGYLMDSGNLMDSQRRSGRPVRLRVG